MFPGLNWKNSASTSAMRLTMDVVDAKEVAHAIIDSKDAEEF